MIKMIYLHHNFTGGTVKLIKPSLTLKYDGVEHKNIVFDNDVAILDNTIKITRYTQVMEDCDAIKWMYTFKNISDADSKSLSEIWDCDMLVEMEPNAWFHPGYRCDADTTADVVSMYGIVNSVAEDYEIADEFRMVDNFMQVGMNKTFCPVQGTSSTGYMPYFDVKRGNKGSFVGIGWSGQWEARFARTKDGIVVKTGIQDLDFYLYPGEEVRTSSVFVMEYDCDQATKYNKIRKLMRKYFSLLTKPGRPKNGPLSIEGWGGLPSDEMIRRINKLKEEKCNFEYYWIDAGWHGEGKELSQDCFTGDWALHTGNWNVNTKFHPDGMLEVSKAIEDAGMKLLLWFEPERVVDTCPLVKEHPEWLLKAYDYNYMYNLGIDEAREHMFKTICKVIDTLHVKCYRQDYNFLQSATCWKEHDEPGRHGLCQIKQITGLYKLWDSLLERYPDITIDDCAGGGKRLDFELLSRSIPIWRSDFYCVFNPNPDVIQVHTMNISRYLPYTGGAIKIKSDLYAHRSTYAAAWTAAFWCSGFLKMDDHDFEVTRKAVSDYNKIRDYFYEDFYELEKAYCEDTNWAAYQYDRPNHSDGIIMAFRRRNSSCKHMDLPIKGILRNKTYEFYDIDTEDKVCISGSNLIENGFPLDILEKYSSKIIMYKAL